MNGKSTITVVLSALLFLSLHGFGNAEDEEKKEGWFFTAEFAVVTTAGNSETSTFGLGSTLRRVWSRSEANLKFGGIRSESSVKTRTAIGLSPDDFRLEETKQTEKTAENYYARARYDYKVTDRFDVFGGVDWMRNVFAGTDSRFLLAAGAANIWKDKERVRFSTDYSVTYTFEQDVVDNPFVSSKFPGLRLGYDFWSQLTESTEFISDFILDWNLDNTEDVRIDFLNELPISVTEKLAFKPSLRLLWRNDPALTSVPLFEPDGTDTGNTVSVPLEELDAIFTIALVVKL